MRTVRNLYTPPLAYIFSAFAFGFPHRNNYKLLMPIIQAVKAKRI